MPISEKRLIGNFVRCYIGYSTDKYVRWISSSGGAVTSILTFMMEEGLIDGALVVKMEGLRPKQFIARRPKDLILAAGSKYLPIQSSIKLKELMDSKGKYAIVGLPCYIRAIRNLMARSEKLRKHVTLLLGLFCCRSISPTGFKVLLHKLRVNEEEIEEFRFRGHGWPGRLHISLKDGRKISLPYFDYWRPLYSPYFFTPKACMFCSDMTNEKADISFGDAWLPKIIRKDVLGSSMIISRSEEADKILQEAQRKGFLKLASISEKEVIKAQWRSLFFKKTTLPARLLLAKRRNYASAPGGFFKVACALIQLMNIRISESHLGKHIIERLPFAFLQFYAVLHAMIEYFSWRYITR